MIPRPIAKVGQSEEACEILNQYISDQEERINKLVEVMRAGRDVMHGDMCQQHDTCVAACEDMKAAIDD